jgi:MFS family permease
MVFLASELVSTFPLGYASDRFGRKTILYINLVCMASGYGWAMIVGDFTLATLVSAISY